MRGLVFGVTDRAVQRSARLCEFLFFRQNLPNRTFYMKKMVVLSAIQLSVAFRMVFVTALMVAMSSRQV